MLSSRCQRTATVATRLRAARDGTKHRPHASSSAASEHRRGCAAGCVCTAVAMSAAADASRQVASLEHESMLPRLQAEPPLSIRRTARSFGGPATVLRGCKHMLPGRPGDAAAAAGPALPLLLRWRRACITKSMQLSSLMVACGRVAPGCHLLAIEAQSMSRYVTHDLPWAASVQLNASGCKRGGCAQRGLGCSRTVAPAVQRACLPGRMPRTDCGLPVQWPPPSCAPVAGCAYKVQCRFCAKLKCKFS